MKKILIFGGTTEGRSLSEALSKLHFDITVSVATEYGYSLMDQNIKTIYGRMDAEEMKRFFISEKFDTVIDATHPYAIIATENIKKAAMDTGIKYMRLLREKSDTKGLIIVKDIAEAIEIINQNEGNILLSTGSKDLEAYTKVSDFSERVYPRVLPTVEAIEACDRLGYKKSNIIAMQGPFSKEINLALYRQFNIKILITKDGGKAGGFMEKIEAARECNLLSVVIKRSEEEGMSFKEILSAFKEEI